MENTILMQACAKINLSLDVTGKREDGYHTVKMIMQTIDLHDDVRVALTQTGQLTLSCNLSFLPVDAHNIAYQAAQLFYAKTGVRNPGTEIKIWKRIPVAAGLAGGSTNAAAVLRALNHLHQTALSIDTLCEYGLELGADVPYCLRGGTMLAEGIGEVLTPLQKLPHCYVVLARPPYSVSTKEVYAQMNGGKISLRPDTNGLLQAITQGNYDEICHRMYNVMEPITSGWHSEIQEIKDVLFSCGAQGAVMSGSGPTVFGLFDQYAHAEKAYRQLKAQYTESYLSQTV